MDNKLVVFFGEKRRVCASSPDNILGVNTPHWRGPESTAEVGDVFKVGTWQTWLGRAVLTNSIHHGHVSHVLSRHSKGNAITSPAGSPTHCCRCPYAKDGGGGIITIKA
jgi:hypothetical protein